MTAATISRVSSAIDGQKRRRVRLASICVGTAAHTALRVKRDRHYLRQSETRGVQDYKDSSSRPIVGRHVEA
jgi:hypothetical protein